MAIKDTKRGFTLLIAVIFMSVMLSFGLALASLGYKQLVLSSGAVGSQYAFYAADAALECVLYYDQQRNTFVYGSGILTAPSFSCGNNTPDTSAPPTKVSVGGGTTAAAEVLTYRFLLDSTRCADVKIYKYGAVQPSGFTTYIFSEGYDVACSALGSSPRSVARGINAHY